MDMVTRDLYMILTALAKSRNVICTKYMKFKEKKIKKEAQVQEKNTSNGEKDSKDKEYKALFEEALQIIRNLSFVYSPDHRRNVQKAAFEFIQKHTDTFPK